MLTALVRRAGEWLVEPPPEAMPAMPARPLEVQPPRHPLIGVVALARRSGATTIARALAAELAARAGGAAVVASPDRPDVVALGSSRSAARLAGALGQLGALRTAGRLCLGACDDATRLASATRPVAPAVMEVEPGCAALDAAEVVDRLVLVATPALEPALAAAVADTVAAVGPPPLVVVNRAGADGRSRVHADVLVPEGRLGAQLALAGREPRGRLGVAVGELADLCEPG